MGKIVLTHILVAFFAFYPAPSNAEDESTLSVYAKACEPFKTNEAKSSVRVRATDKASFKALENLSDLASYRNSYDTADYNVLIYTLIDNYLEDLTVRTLEQNEERLCVEVTGYLTPDNIGKAVNDIAAQKEARYPSSLEIEQKALTAPSVSGLPPKPEIKISDDIAVENFLAEDGTPAKTAPTALSDALAPFGKGKAKVYIERTKFYNDTTTNAFHIDLAQALEENPQLLITNSLSDADYLVKTKVLRAKVDPINKQTRRLQMVIALELVNTTDGEKMTEHQNRFILFESSENEQNVAASLLRKLLRKAAQRIAPKIKTPETDGAVITPTAGSYDRPTR